MENLRYLLAAIAALTLLMSVVSGVNPSYFAGLNAFADHDEEDDDDNSGSSSGSNGDHDEDDEEHEDDEKDDDDDKDNKHEDDEDKLVQSLGNNSKVTLEIDEDEVELGVEIEEGDLDDGIFDVMFACDSPDVDEEFADVLEVEDGEGEFEEDLELSNGTYTGCEVEAGDLSATFPSFNIMPDDDDEEDDEQEDEDEQESEDEDDGREKESRLKVEDDGVEIEFEAEDLNMTDGSYDAVFACDDPDISVTLDDALEVEEGEGELEAEIRLANGTYSGCELVIRGTVLASFDTFTVDEDDDDNSGRGTHNDGRDDDEDADDDKREERKKRIINSINDGERHRRANLHSPGEYKPGWNYTLEVDGMATHNENVTHDADAAVDIDMSVWKSNRAIILLEVVGGTIEVENQDYNVRIGYAIYSIQQDVMKVVALATDNDGDIFRLKLRGGAVDEGDQFPMESGSINLVFGGSAGESNNRFEEWSLTLEGTVEAS